MYGAMYDEVASFYDRCVREGWQLHAISVTQVIQLIGDVKGDRILDVGCGQGVLARLINRKGAEVTAIDLSVELLRIAEQYNVTEGYEIRYIHDDAQFLSKIEGESFDGAVCNLSLMDIQDVLLTFKSVNRILNVGGWFVFSITHPCFRVPAAEYEATEDKATAKIGRGYYREGSWDISNPAGRPGEIGEHHRMLSTYINALAQAHFTIECAVEPETELSDIPVLLLFKVVKAS